MLKVLINGMGVVGRELFKLLVDHPSVEVVAINDRFISTANLAYLLQYETIYHDCKHTITYSEDDLYINGKNIPFYCCRDDELANLPAGKESVDVVIDCTGRTKPDQIQYYIYNGARRVLACHNIGNNFPTIALGVNESSLTDNHTVFSLGSMETQVLARLLKIMDDKFRVQWATFKSFRSYTNSQSVMDSADSQFAFGRAAAYNICPASDAAAKNVGLVIPRLNGKVTGSGFRAPIIAGGAINVIANLQSSVTVDGINAAVKELGHNSLSYEDQPLCSSDALGLEYPAFLGKSTVASPDDNGGTIADLTVLYDNVRGYARVIQQFLEWYAQKSW